MTMPLTQPAITPTDFDLFLDEVGLSMLPQEEKDAIADRMREAASYLTVKLIQQRLTDDQLKELADHMDAATQSGNHMAVNEFLLRAIPDIESLADEAVSQAKNHLRDSMRDLPSMIDLYKQVASGEKSVTDVIGDAMPANKEPDPIEASFNDAMDATEVRQPDPPDTLSGNSTSSTGSSDSQEALENELKTLEQSPLSKDDATP